MTQRMLRKTPDQLAPSLVGASKVAGQIPGVAEQQPGLWRRLWQAGSVRLEPALKAMRQLGRIAVATGKTTFDLQQGLLFGPNRLLDLLGIKSARQAGMVCEHLGQLREYPFCIEVERRLRK